MRPQVGNALFWVGALMLPLGIGAVAGYWIADSGARWVPDTIGGLLLLWGLALVLMIAGSVMTRSAVARNRKRIFFFTGLAAVAAMVRFGVHLAAQPSPLRDRTPETFAALHRDDAQLYRDLDRMLARSVNTVAVNIPEATVLSADQERVVKEAFAAYVDTAFALDQVRRFYEDYYHLDLSRLERDRHTLAFLLTFAAELALYEHTQTLIDAVSTNKNAEKLLDQEDRLSRVKEQLLGMTDYSRVVAGENYLRYLRELHDVDAEVVASGNGWLWEDVEARLARATAKGSATLALTALTSDFAPLEKNVKHVTFPVQKGVAEWMGDTRVRRAGRYLIGHELQEKLRTQLLPGDVMLARKNWYLSNVGLPGFWPHAMIYVGSEEQLVSTFGQAFVDGLRRKFPEAWAEKRRHPDRLIIEAISEGVSQSNLEHTVGDYVAVLRPNLTKAAKAQAIERAFTYLNRPYDFDFDFATDDALVCTELVWRSYRTQEGEVGLHFTPVKIAGRLTLPANEIARVYREERGSEAPQMNFVAFIEGREQQQDAVFSDESAFIGTVDRSKWDFGQP